jgi:2-keto-4-pentenoate hydratase/2-oxohepta-3-ene-1,7-dioic acid hydratase in catechol pathway
MIRAVRLVTYDDGSGEHAGILLGEEIVPAASVHAPARSVRGRFLRDGDVVEVEVDGLGAVSNRVRAA